MSRSCYVWRQGRGVVPIEEAGPSPRHGNRLGDAPMICSDIQSYRSIITGEPITSRSQHRQHLKQHGCIELGNEQPRQLPKAPLPPVRQDLERAIANPLSKNEIRNLEQAAKKLPAPKRILA